jgi:hypothetical protein
VDSIVPEFAVCIKGISSPSFTGLVFTGIKGFEFTTGFMGAGATYSEFTGVIVAAAGGTFAEGTFAEAIGAA